MTRIAAAFLFLTILLLPLAPQAEQAKDFGDYTIHYSAFTTDILSPEVAKSYGIRRSGNRVLLNISVLKKVMGTSAQPVRAVVEANATNLSSQLRELETREIKDDLRKSKTVPVAEQGSAAATAHTAKGEKPCRQRPAW